MIEKNRIKFNQLFNFKHGEGDEYPSFGAVHLPLIPQTSVCMLSFIIFRLNVLIVDFSPLKVAIFDYYFLYTYKKNCIKNDLINLARFFIYPHEWSYTNSMLNAHIFNIQSWARLPQRHIHITKLLMKKSGSCSLIIFSLMFTTCHNV